MRSLKLALLASIFTIPALAQQPPPPAFIPWTVTQEESDSITKFLADKPYAIAAPIISWLASKEQQAQQADAAEKAKKPTEPTPATPPKAPK